MMRARNLFDSNRFPALVLAGVGVILLSTWLGSKSGTKVSANAGDVSVDSTADLIGYGRELVAHTARYLGPEGVVSQTTNGMNCQNCHLEAGTKPYGNNYYAVSSGYPRFRARSGTVESVEKRVNDCLERSLNGKTLSPDSRELKAFVAYILSVGTDRTGKEPGTGLPRLAFLDQPADTARGRVVFEKHCVTCHGNSGRGQRSADGKEWLYPPLWGDDSYNIGAGLFRLSRFAAFVRYNMPLGVNYDSTVLTDEEAWHVAAFVNSKQRPYRDLSSDWPDIKTKPVDHPFGPYADPFTETQHKYGPFKTIEAYYEDSSFKAQVSR